MYHLNEFDLAWPTKIKMKTKMDRENIRRSRRVLHVHTNDTYACMGYKRIVNEEANSASTEKLNEKKMSL